MSVTSFYFICFVAVLLLAYYLLPKRFQWWILLAASIVFFVCAGSWKTIPYLLYGIGVSYFGALRIASMQTVKQKKIAVVVTVLLEVLLLVALKYLNFFITTGNMISSILGMEGRLDAVSYLAPIGMSFYTMSIIGYVIDVYRGVSVPQRNFFRHAVFCSYFPQMISGPITRYGEMEPQFFSEHRFNWHAFLFGLERIAWGFFKKLVISERLSYIVNTVYGDYGTHNGLYIPIAAICFALQLYTDFSGCMDIVLGVSELLGIKLPENFNTPFFSRSIAEYWRRWHITLGTWFKDYVFYPLLRSNAWQRMGKWCKKHFRKKTARQIPTYIGMFVLWFGVGFWHGGAYTFIIGSGLLHWFYIVMGEVSAPLSDRITAALGIDRDSFSWHLFQKIRTFLLVCLGLLFFRASSVTEGLHMLRSMLTVFNPKILFDGSLLSLGLDKADFSVMVIGLLSLLCVSLLQLKGSVRDQLEKQNLIFRWAVIFALLFSILIFGLYGVGYNAQNFIYQQF